MLLFSCNKEHMGGDEQLPEGAVQISLSLPNVGPRSRADVHTDEENKTTDESRIKSATVLFYDHTDQTLTKKISTGEDGIKWNDAGKKVIVLAGKIDLTTPYDIVVLTNMPDAAALDGSIAEGDARAKLNEVFSKLTSQIVLDDKHTLVMMGETKNHTFSKNITASVALAHQAVKIRVNLALTTEFCCPLWGAFHCCNTASSAHAL
ncbi:MAG: fimbrial protein [Rikenellaceae bacterium]